MGVRNGCFMMAQCIGFESYNVSNPHGQFSATYKATTSAYYFVYPYFSISGASSNTYVTFQVSVNGNVVYTSTFYSPPNTFIDLGYLNSGAVITTNIQMYGPGSATFYKIYICYSSTNSPPPLPTTSTSSSKSTTPPPPPPPSTHGSSTSSSSTLSSTLIIWPIILIVAIIIVVVLVVYLLRKKK